MNFFKKLFQRQTLTILDDTQERKSISNDLTSSSLRKNDNLSNIENYESLETRLFEEPLVAAGQNDVKNIVQNQDTNINSNTIIPISPHSNNDIQQQHLIFDQRHSVADTEDPVQSPSVAETRTNQHVRLPSTLSDEENSQEMMALYAAIIRGEKGKVKKILTDHPECLEAPDNFGRTPLMYCVLSDRIDCAKLMLKMKANLHQKDKAGRSALHLAAHKGIFKFVELLYERGANIEMQDNDGQTPLHLTTRNRHVRCLDFLLRHLRAGMAEVTDNQERTALHWSAAFNNEESVRLLIKYHCNPAVSDIEGKTPLHWAANTHDPSVVHTLKTLLYSSPSALNWQDYEGRTALHFAVAHENVLAVEFLLNFDQEKCEVDRLDNTFRTPLHWAAQLGNSNIVKLLLSAGAKNAITDENGATPFLYGALNNKSDVVSEMIQQDRSILEQADVEGRTALMWAAGKGANNVIKLLLGFDTQPENSTKKEAVNKGPVLVDINRVDNKGNTALHMAALNGCAISVQLLLDSGSKHHLQNNLKHTPIFGACEKGHLAVVEYLLDCNAIIKLGDLEGRTPLHWAAIGGHAEVCELLIKTDLNPNVRDNLERTPLHCAAFGGFINCMNVLLENKANVDLQDQEGMSALHWAAQCGHLDATKLLFQCSAFPNLMEHTEERLTPLDHALLNGKEEVAQYFIEQGALSSETIRDIAAARIQACFRGYQVRKGFLNRKDFLLQHKILRNQKDKNRAKKKPVTSSTDQLNSVCEEPTPLLPVVSPYPYASDEENSVEVTAEPEANVRTIKSLGIVSLLDSNAPEYPSQDDVGQDDSDVPRKTSEQHEDDNLVPFRSLFIAVPHPPQTPNCDANADDQLSEKPQDSSERTCDLDDNRRRPSQLLEYSHHSLDNVSFSSTQVKEFDTKTQAFQDLTDSSVIPSLDTASAEDKKRSQKRKKKKKQRTTSIPPESTSSDRMSTELHKKRSKRRLRENEKSFNKTSDYVDASSDGDRRKSTLTSSLASESSALINLSPTPLPNKDLRNSESSPTYISNTNDHMFSTLPSQLNDENSARSDGKIVVDVVKGLPHLSGQNSPTTSLMQTGLDATSLNPDLSLSEYIESLMSLSLNERKILSSIQQNRKQAFRRANHAAAVIQSAWRRYFRAKNPPFELNPIINPAQNLGGSHLEVHDHVDPSPQDQTPFNDTPDSPVKHQHLASSRSDVRRGSDFKEKSILKLKAKNSSESDVVGKNKLPQQLTTSSVASKKVKPSPKNKKRPQTVSQPSANRSDAEISRNDKTKHTLAGFIVSDVDSEYFSRTRKVRAKTGYSRHRRRHLEHFTSYQDNTVNQDLDKKIKDLWKIYGQVAAQPSEAKNSSRNISNSLFRSRPIQSVVVGEFEEPQFFDPRSNDPVTAVQSYSINNWNNISNKKPTSPVQKRSIRRKREPSRTKSQSNKMKKASAGVNPLAVSRGTKHATPSSFRFSYNLKGTKVHT